ncbi:serine/threonine-protein kinase [Streptomyces niger]|uniref:serine/threonine-protein kinase n=1 Tax=Streptomyces niger TaxID=66373 RepID=UPI00069CA0CD|nr:serine/threonine-protein kinase [Streptomyces niger]
MHPLSTGDPLRLGPYRLLGVLGVGGMGKVYLGRDQRGTPVAVKVLRPELAHDAEMAQRFLREAQAARAVTGKGVARVLGAQTEGGRQWIASEFLAGPTLDEAVERFGPLPEAAVRVLCAALARTLADIHTAGLVHRDIKPPNIVLTSGGPRVIDFGIARPEHGLTLTSAGEAPATPGYGAPEQVLGRRTGPAGDVFALGAVLAYAASGRRAFEGGHVAAVQYEVVHGEPELGSVPEGLRGLVQQCLAKDPAARPTPEAVVQVLAPPRRSELPWRRGPVADEIARREADARQLAEIPGLPDEAGAGPSRRRVLRAVAAGGTVLAAGGGAAVWWALRGGGSAGPQPWEARPLSTYTQNTVPEPLWGPVDAAAAEAPMMRVVRDLLVVAAPGGALHAYGVTDGKRRWTSPPAATAAGVLSTPDDGQLLTAAPDGSLLAVGATDGKRAWQVRGAAAARLLARDDDSVYVLTRDGSIRAVDPDAHTVRWTVACPVGAEKHALGAAVVAQRLVLHGSDGKLAALEKERGRTVWGPKEQGGRALTPAVADGTVYVGGRSLTAYGAADGARKWSQPVNGEHGSGAPTVRGGVLYLADGTDLSVRRASDGTEEWTLPLDGLALSTAPPVVVGHGVWVASTGREQDTVAAVDTRGGSVAWSYTPGTRGDWHLATADNRVFLLQAGTLTAMPVF